MRAMLCIGFFLIGLLGSAEAATINWEVYNRFRFYRDAEIFRDYLATARLEADSAGKNWVLQSERALQKKYHAENPGGKNGWAADHLKEAALCWSPMRKRAPGEKGYYAELDDCNDYIAPVSHRVILSVKDTPDLESATCVWTVKAVAPFDPTSPSGVLWRRRTAGGVVQNSSSCSRAIAHIPYWSDDARNGALVSVTVRRGSRAETLPETRIAVRDIAILGAGDSFGAGVGNPDKPAAIHNTASLITRPPGYNIAEGDSTPNHLRLPVRPGASDGGGTSDQRFVDGAAQWQDVRCFRSQYGPQFRAALQLAVATPHAAVTFLDLACDGARIIEGLLGPKKLNDAGLARFGAAPSQLGQAALALCRERPNVFTRRIVPRSSASEAACAGGRDVCDYPVRQHRTDPDLVNIRIAGCKEDTAARALDYVLLSIGGNDIGFAPMVAYAVLEDGAINNLMDRVTDSWGLTHTPAIGVDRLRYLRAKYQHLSQAIDGALPLRGGDQSRVLISAYPMPVADVNGKVCGATSDNASGSDDAMRIDELFGGFVRSNAASKVREVLNASCALNQWRYNWFAGTLDSRRDRSRQWGEDLPACAGAPSPPATALPALPWSYVSGHVRDGWRHGFCATEAESDLKARAAEELKMPGYELGALPPAKFIDLKDFRPYHSRARWVRTLNDAYLISNWHQPGVQNSRKNAQVAAATSSMHMTAEGYANMADNLLGALLNDLCKREKDRLGEFKPKLSACEKWAGSAP